MTTLQDKSPSELNVICAELCGWHHIHNDGPELVVGHRRWQNEPDVDAEPLPLYATSYDAIMPYVKALKKEDRFRFIQILSDIRRDSDGPFTWTMVTSSEADLTRALILVLQSK